MLNFIDGYTKKALLKTFLKHLTDYGENLTLKIDKKEYNFVRDLNKNY